MIFEVEFFQGNKAQKLLECSTVFQFNLYKNIFRIRGLSPQKFLNLNHMHVKLVTPKIYKYIKNGLFT